MRERVENPLLSTAMLIQTEVLESRDRLRVLKGKPLTFEHRFVMFQFGVAGDLL